MMSGEGVTVIPITTTSTTAAIADERHRVATSLKERTEAQYIVATRSFVSGADIYGCYMEFASKTRMNGDILHSRRGFGQIMAVNVDLKQCPYTPEALRPMLWWAGFGALPMATEDEDPAQIVGGPSSNSDARAWFPRLHGQGPRGVQGTGSFVGLYRSAQHPDKGLLVVHSVALPNQQKYRQTVRNAEEGTLTYGDFACDKMQHKLRRLMQRNAAMVLHDAMVCIGLDNEAGLRSLIDVDSVAAVGGSSIPEALDMRHALISSTRNGSKPIKVRPDIHNEMDIMTMGDNVVEYYDGVACIADAKGGLLAFKNGRPGQGVYVMKDEQVRISGQKFWDGGFTFVDGWKMNTEWEKLSQAYDPISVVFETPRQ
jgi:hypothetical protein